jgi:hypothetical protein
MAKAYIKESGVKFVIGIGTNTKRDLVSVDGTHMYHIQPGYGGSDLEGWTDVVDSSQHLC